MSESTHTSITVLIIDDDSLIRNYIRSTLIAIDGVDVINAATASDGMAKFKRYTPQLVFLDINLPDKDGLTLLQELLLLDKMANIFMISGDSTFDNVKAALDHGARGFMVKPFSMQKILDSFASISAAK